MRWQDRYCEKLVTAKEAAGLVKSGQRIVVSLAQKPRQVLLELANRAGDLRGVELLSHWNEDYPWLHPGMEDAFDVRVAFILPPSRQGVREKRLDWVPIIFGLYNNDRNRDPNRLTPYQHADIFMLSLTPPNARGYCSFGLGPWYSPTSLRTAGTVIAQIDSGLPWTCGESVHISEIDYLVEAPPSAPDAPPTVLPIPDPGEFEQAQVIGALAAGLVRDGDTIQVGTGTPSEAVVDFLGDKNELGVYSEIIYRQIVELMANGVIAGARRNGRRRKATTACLWLYPNDPAAREVIEFVDHNRQLEFRDVSYLCQIPRIAANHSMVTINTILAVDLQGQAVIDHIGPTPISGPGGQVEFTIGAHYSPGGRSITCLLSTARGGTVSRIVPQLETGTVVQLPMTYIDYLVTENGVVNLEGKSRRERAEAVISVAHPDFQPDLGRAAQRLFWP
ncbi:MAG: acetyl-CoA hydrolase/transferase C-terminal domain-containing protein [Dehalococcoidia bacterium]|jgi:4-hydroxybutyrate CoA-transferase|nr:acetyl-CoA hydrolase/transferase C-terminal domain-containing protein [Dehalococcoidia bacterium]